MDEFNMDLAFLKKRQTDDIVENVMDEKNICNKLIVMGDVSGLTDRLNDFANLNLIKL